MFNAPNPKTNPEPTPELCVIVPCRNEASILPYLFQQLATQTNIVLQVILADGQSTDSSRNIAKTAGAEVTTSQPGRGLQMNTAARQSRAPWLLFLHADSSFSHPQQLHYALRYMQQQHGAKLSAGHFALHFTDRPATQKRWRILEYKTTTNRPLTISGDQGLFIHRQHFEALGGYNDSLPFLEDQILAANIHQQGQWHLLPHPLITSARRFQTQGFANRYWLMTLIMLAHYCKLPGFLNPQAQYPEQNRARGITLADHIKHFHSCVLKQSPSNIVRSYWRIAGMARENIYQTTLWTDAALNTQTWPLTKAWQSTAEKITHIPVIKQVLQFVLLPVMPLVSLFLLLTAKIDRSNNSSI